MGMTLPGWLTEPLGWIGLTWPEADEEKLFDAGQVWLTFATDVGPIAQLAGATATSVWDNNQNDVTDAFKNWWTDDLGPEKRLLEDQVAAMLIGAACILFAAITLMMKIWFIIQLIILAVQVAMAIAAAFFSFGASTATIPGFVAACRTICMRLVKKAIDFVQTGVKKLLTKAKNLLKKVKAKYKAAQSRRIMNRIEADLKRVNPKFDPNHPQYGGNCIHCVQAYELRRRGYDVSATGLPRNFWPNWGRNNGDLTGPWGRNFTSGGKADIEKAFENFGPGSRGVVQVRWPNGGGHVFNVENVNGKIVFVDGQGNLLDASSHFLKGVNPSYVRLDDLPIPPGTHPNFAN